jgi:ubiquitin-protein ligase E3 C
MAGSMLDEERPERLPTASTCVNLLKLPPYRTKEVITATRSID